MRIFFALWPPADTAAKLGAWADDVQREAGGRRTTTGNIHLTLAFLGDADAARAIECGKAVSGRVHELPMQQGCYWPQNQIVWAGPRRLPEALGALVDGLKLELGHRGFVVERRPFAAHVTLLRKARPPKSLPTLPAIAWPAAEFVLAKSTISRQGSTYTVLERFPLS